MNAYLLTPPAVFIIILAVSWLLSCLSSLISFKKKGTTDGGGKAYACGEDSYDNMARPDYGQFFLFAFFFTIAHVSTLIITTMPKGALDVFLIATAYIVVGLVSLLIIFRS
jgi:NADH:ubiquinone oxidoreductase subunit 3 (subunit A)